METVFNDIIAPTFEPVFFDVLEGAHSEYWIKGGRGSAKSSFIALTIVEGIISDPEANAIVYRRYGNTLQDSVYSQIVWAIDMLGVTGFFKFRKSPLEIETRTGQRIMFRGLDDPAKSKSVKLAHGYFKFLWIEELSEVRSYTDIRTIKQSVFRGSKRHAATMFSYNPPKSAAAWVNKEVLEAGRDDRLVHTSTYLDVDPDWIGDEFIREAETLRRTNPTAYANEYLGDVTGNGGNVFENLKLREIKDDEIDTFEWFYQGVDWGYFPDPFAWVRMAFDAKRRALYIIGEYVGNKLSNLESFNAVKERLSYDEPLTADSAEPKSIADWKEYGASHIRGANKSAIDGRGSVAYSMKWLASLSEIIIDPRRAPVSAQEFSAYEYERNSAGEFVSGYIDHDNHTIDAVRYALSPIWRRRGL